MPGLIQRYDAVAEHSAFLSTSPTSPTTDQRIERHRRHHQACSSESVSLSPPPGSRSRSPRAALRDEASEWYDALAPPLADVQAVIRRMQADPDLSQDRVFAHLCPAVVLCALLAIVLIALREDSYVHRMLDDACWRAGAARLAALAICGVTLSVVTLKCIIFCVAEGCAVVVAMETREEMRAKHERGVPTSGLVFGGMLM